MVEKGRFVSDDKDMWSEHLPSSEEENKYIEKNGIKNYGKWYLGVDTDENEDTKGRYKFPYSDFSRVHRCGVLLQKAEPDNTNISILKKEQHICMHD